MKRLLMAVLILCLVPVAAFADNGVRYGFETADDGYFVINVNKVNEDTKYGLLDWDGNTVVEPVYDMFLTYSDGIAVFRAGDEIAYVEVATGEVSLVDMGNVGYFGDFYDGLALVQFEGDKWGYVDINGSIVIEPKYGMAPKWYEDDFGMDYYDRHEFSEGYAVVQENGREGVIDRSGQIIIPLEHDYIEPCKEGVFVTWDDWHWGAYSADGSQITEAKWDSVSVIDGFVGVAFEDNTKENGSLWRYGLFDRDGNAVLECVWRSIKVLNTPDGVLILAEDEDRKIYILNYDGSVWISTDWTAAEVVNDNVIAVTSDEGLRFFNTDAQVIGDPEVYYGKYIQTGYDMYYDVWFMGPDDSGYIQAWIYMGGSWDDMDIWGKWCLIDPDGRPVSDVIYDEISWCGEGMASVNIEDKWGYVSTDGGAGIEPVYDEAYGFSGDLAPVILDDESYIIDKSGNIIIQVERYTDIPGTVKHKCYIVWNGLDGDNAAYIVRLADKNFYIIDSAGNTLFPK